MKIKAFKVWPIKKQILAAMSTVAVMGIVILGTVVFALFKKTMEDNYRSGHIHNLGVSGHIIEIQLEKIVEGVRGLLVDDKFMGILENTPAESAPYFNSVDGLYLEHMLREVRTSNEFIRDVVVVSTNGNIRAYIRSNEENGRMRKYYSGTDILDADWVKAADAAIGREVCFAHNVLFEGDTETFSLVKLMKDPWKSKVNAGYVIVNINKKMLAEAFGEPEEDYISNHYFIIRRTGSDDSYSENENLVYFQGDEPNKESIINDYLFEETSSKYLFSSVKNNISGWEIVNVVDRQELNRDISYARTVAIAVGAIVVLLCALSSSTISKYISRPLDTLVRVIEKVGEGNYRINETFDETEIGKIGDQFKSVISNNIELRENLLSTELKEKEAELMLLQSQINPHFLYNTLDALYFRAIIDGADDVAEMVLALSDTFKLSLNKGEKVCFVSDSVKRLESYMKIQNMRHPGRFEFTVEVEEDMLDKRILSFILQPLLENAVYHGLEPKIGKGYISIDGYIQGEEMFFTVRDNGVGIDDLSRVDEGYGIKNIRERMKLFYGDEYDLMFDSKAGSGTTVTFSVPILSEDKIKPEDIAERLDFINTEKSEDPGDI